MRPRLPIRFPALSLLFLGGLGLLWACTTRPAMAEIPPPLTKQKGAHVFGHLDSSNMDFLHDTHVEWVTVVTWGYLNNISDSLVTHHNGDSTMIEESNASFLRWVGPIREAGFKVFVKPHVWIYEVDQRGWRSDVFPVSDSGWEQWKETYRNFMLRYARLAEEVGAEMFCIGTELTRLSLEKPQFWREFIQEIREVSFHCSHPESLTGNT
ncbi:MAG: hypothetical protein AAFR61_11720, partial [Bacteroidota bacterium]